MKLISSRELADELKQRQAVTESLINKILYSKRLLADHVDALEHCLAHLPGSTVATEGANASRRAVSSKKTSHDIFTARNTCVLLGSTLLEHLITPKSLRLTLIPSVLVAGGFSALYVVKNIFVFRNMIVERELDNLISTIDSFGNCIRRNMTYFNDILIMKPQEVIELHQIERAWDCITATKEVTEILYEATRQLEACYPIPPYLLQYYAPIEELLECEYFKNNITDYTPKHIKEFHNIFSYVQSQFLLCLALAIATRPPISKLNTELVKVDCLIRKLVNAEEKHFRHFTYDLTRKSQMELESLNAARTMQNRSGPVALLKDSSLKLNARMAAVSWACQGLDFTLQRITETEAENKENANQLVEVAQNMRAIEGSLSVCFDDFQRLMLVYSKFLSSKDDRSDENAGDNRNDTSDNEFAESFLRVEISQHQNDAEKKDDFYAYMFDEQQAKKDASAEQKLPRDLEILNFEKRITKGKFRPVLKQLKDRIDPIRKVMLDKEREVLTAKGFNVDELFGKEGKDTEAEGEAMNNKRKKSRGVRFLDKENDAEANGDATESDGSADLEFEERRTKQLKDRDNFAEMRNFLAQKQAINLLKMEAQPAPTNAVGDEDILESEC